MFATAGQDDWTVFNLLVLAAVTWAVVRYRRRRPGRTAFGTAEWASDKLLRAWGMLGGRGLVLGRTLGGALIRLPRSENVLLVGGTGSGKGVGLVIPNLLDYARGSLVAFDPKGDLYATTAARRQALGHRVVRLAPFDGGPDRLNPLDAIPADSPLLVDHARALAESLVVRQGTEPDAHWNDKAVQAITALLVLVLRSFAGAERSLSSVQDIASDPAVLAAAADRLREMGGIPGRLGSQLRGLFDRDGTPTKEGAGVLSTVARHLSFLDSEPVAWAVAASTFDVGCLLRPGVTVYLQVPPDQLEAQRGLLRCWVATLIRAVGRAGSERAGEVLFLLDEASALASLTAVEEALVRGRSAGVRLLLAYQSDAQVRTAFKDKPTLLYDNCGTQVYLGATGYETAERVSKSLGDWTQVVENSGENHGYARNTGGDGGGQVSRGWSTNSVPQGRPLLRPEEVLRLGDEYLIAFVGGLPAPVVARRIRWYADPAFNPAVKTRRGRRGEAVGWFALGFLALVIGVLVGRAKALQQGYWQPEPEGGVRWPRSARGR